MAWLTVLWVVLIVGPGLGVLAVAFLAFFHDFGEGNPWLPAPLGALRAPTLACRASTEVLHEYLSGGPTGPLRRHHRRGSRRLRRSCEFGGARSESAGGQLGPAHSSPPNSAPARLAGEVAPPPPAPRQRRAAHPTRLVPLSP